MCHHGIDIEQSDGANRYLRCHLVHFGSVYAESLFMKELVRDYGSWVFVSTDRCNPFATSAWDARPVIIAHLGVAFGIRTGNLASDFTLLEERLHPGSLRVASVSARPTEHGGTDCLDEISRASGVM